MHRRGAASLNILVDGSGASSGGMQTFMREVFSTWKDLYAEDTLTIVGTDDLIAKLTPILGPWPTYVDFGSGSQLRRMWAQQVLVPRMARRVGANVVFCVVPLTPLLLRSTPVVAYAHDFRHQVFPEEFSWLQRTYRSIVYPLCLRHADVVLCNSLATSAEVTRLSYKQGAQNAVAYLGCTLPDRAERIATTDDRQPPYAIAYGHWTNKRPDVSIRTWAELRQRNLEFPYHLRIVGVPSDQIPELESLAVALGVGDVVSVQSTVADAEYWPMLTDARLVLLPSTFEGWGLPIIEAFRLGLPVVCTPDAGMEEAGSTYAWYADEDSVLAFASAVELALEATEANRLRQLAAMDYSQQFTWERTVHAMRKSIQQAAHAPEDTVGSESTQRGDMKMQNTLRNVSRKFHRAVELAPDYVFHPSRLEHLGRGVHPGVLPTIDQPWLRDMSIRTFVDVGANTGQFSQAVHAVFPDAQIFAFEPLPSCVGQARERMKGVEGFHIFAAAIGSQDGTITIHESASSPSSSILPMSEAHTEAFPWTAGGQDVEVDLRRLDSFLPEMKLTAPVLLKIDVQGYSMEVLRGAIETIRLCEIVVVETSVVELYDGESTFEEVYTFMRNVGFAFAGALDQLTHPHSKEILQVDAIFRRATKH